MNHSELIKKLRVDRGLSQEKLTAGISQRSTLASFEKQASRISYDTLIKYLDRMNVTLEEYQFMLDDENVTEKRLIAADFYRKMNGIYEESFENFLDQKYCESGDGYYQILKAEYLIVMKKNNPALSFDVDSSITYLAKYLNSINTWGRFELSILINTLFCFEDEYILLHFKKSIKKMKGYIDDLYYSRDILAFLINGVALGYERGSKQLFETFFKEIRFFADELKSLEADLIWKVFRFLTNENSYTSKELKDLYFVLKYMGKEEYISYIKKSLDYSHTELI